MADTAQMSRGEAPPDVIPVPLRFVSGVGRFTIGRATTIVAPSSPAVLRVGRYLAGLLARRTGFAIPVSTQRRSHVLPPATIALRLDDTFDIPPNVDGASRGPAKVQHEAYKLDVAPDRVTLTAQDWPGLLYAAVTLAQLTDADPMRTKSHPKGAALNAISIVDAPRFQWRGFMIDSARHYQSPAYIGQVIEWMALHKLNVLHWHLTDDQGWRLEIKHFPKLTSKGAWRSGEGGSGTAGRSSTYGGFYDQATVRRIVAHARALNITVVPEIDMPGHASAAIYAYPELGVENHPVTRVPTNWGVLTNLFNVEPATFDFLRTVLAEVMGLFPGEYIHIGGDEAVKDQWKNSPRVQARIRELNLPNEDAMQGYMTLQMEAYLESHGRRLIGWDEILEGGLPPHATVMSWHGVSGGQKAAAAGHDAILTPYPTVYLNCADTKPGGTGPEVYTSLENVYRFNPLPAGVTLAEAPHILGIQANLWTEHVSSNQRFEMLVFPRLAAVAEIGWSAPAHIDWQDFQRRLPLQLTRYSSLGIHFSDPANPKPAFVPVGAGTDTAVVCPPLPEPK